MSNPLPTSETAQRPVRAMFLLTSMPVGGAEVLLVNLVRQLDRAQVRPEICCLKERGPLGELLAAEVPVHAGLLANKYDLRVLPRLCQLYRDREIDAVVTVGAGDKMFWGRLAARAVGVPLVMSALHSTGWPDGVGRLNRLLTPWTDRFIAVAGQHQQHLIHEERFPAAKVVLIPNGVDTERFQPDGAARQSVRTALGIDRSAPVFGTVAALRPEKNHVLFVRVAALVHRVLPAAQFLIVGDGPERTNLERTIAAAGLDGQVHLLGTRNDVPDVLAALDAFVLTSHMEANPVSILEALAVGLPVVATRVGSVAETVRHGLTGYLVEPGDAQRIAERCVYLARHSETARQLGAQGRRLVQDQWSLQQMVRRYEDLLSAARAR